MPLLFSGLGLMNRGHSLAVFLDLARSHLLDPQAQPDPDVGLTAGFRVYGLWVRGFRGSGVRV